MESSMPRFRLFRDDGTANDVGSIAAVVPRDTGEVSSRAAARNKAASIPACARCRTFKKRCSRTLPTCDLCAKAGQRCSYSTDSQSSELEVDRLRARVDWLSKYLDDELLDGSGVLEQLETGADLAAVAREGSTAHPKRVSVGSSGSIKRSSQEHAANEPMRYNDGHNGRYPSDSPRSPAQDGLHITTSRSNSTPDTSVSVPDSQLPHDAAARRFVDAYFRNVHRAYPFMDRKKTMQDLESISDISQWQSNVDSTLLYLVMAVGCTSLQRAGRVPEHTMSRFEIAYADIIQQCLHHEGLESIQMLLLLALYSLFDPDGPSAWSIVGIASRQAVSIGLAMKGSFEEESGQVDAEQRHRLFWSLYVLERMMATSLGLPVGTSSAATTVPLPALTVEEFASEHRSNFAQTLLTCRQVIHLRQIEDQIVQQVHHFQAEDSIPTLSSGRKADLQDIRTTVENWYSSGCLASAPDEDNVPVHNSVTWLSARYYYLLLLLYYPSAEQQLIPPSELLGYAQRHIQSQLALFQQRQLPLNRVTLYRFLPVVAVLLSCFATLGPAVPAAALEDVTILVRMLEAFEERWRVAMEVAGIMRDFANAVSSGLASMTSPVAKSDIEGSFDRAVVQPHLTRLSYLMRNELGRSTRFASVEQT